ncbi:YeeE/YedE family protein [Stutzerimonas marianensis]|uniref:YeeE/YedE family protein n=1 Tax=Stutzerimonas marianensis TaxID=2929513 RepID=UPI003C2C95FC
MMIDWLQFSPWSALAGGLLIGLSAGAFIVLNGRVAGISGLIGGLLDGSEGRAERGLFLLGLVLAPLLWRMFAVLPSVHFEVDWPMLTLAGLLVGFGARYGSGCTSGHGVCGIARLSLRSSVATLVFMAAGFVTVYVVRHLLGGT